MSRCGLGRGLALALPLGRGLAEQTQKQLRTRAVREGLYESYAPAKADYSDLMSEVRAAGAAVIYVGGYHAEVALMVRAARDQGYMAQFVSGDAMATEEFGLRHSVDAEL